MTYTHTQMMTPGPWAWKKFGQHYTLVADHGQRAVILAARHMHSEPAIVSRNEDGILEPIDPDHPDMQAIADIPNMVDKIAQLEARRIEFPKATDEQKKSGWKYNTDFLEDVKNYIGEVDGEVPSMEALEGVITYIETNVAVANAWAEFDQIIATKKAARAPFDLVFEQIKSDPDLFRAWKDNIAMAFKDEHARRTKELGVKLVGEAERTIHEIANQAAENFLNLLIRDK